MRSTDYIVDTQLCKLHNMSLLYFLCSMGIAHTLFMMTCIYIRMSAEFLYNSKIRSLFRNSWWEWTGTDDRECTLHAKRQVVSAGDECMSQRCSF